jgi:ankyrin repeat protein
MKICSLVLALSFCIASLSYGMKLQLCSFDEQLVHAVASGNYILTQELLKEKTNANTPGINPLCYAAVQGDVALCELLIAHQIDVNARAEAGMTPLHAAVACGHSDVVKLLLVHGADVNATTSSHSTPLHDVVQESNLAICKLLLAYGADTTVIDQEDCTPLEYAIEFSSAEVCQLLLDNKAYNRTHPSGWSLLHYAASRSDIDLCKLLISRGFNVNATTDKGATPLHCALRVNRDKESSAISQVLLEHGANVNAKNNENKTTLHLAVEHKLEHLIEVLLSYGAKIPPDLRSNTLIKKAQKNRFALSQAKSIRAIAHFLQKGAYAYP